MQKFIERYKHAWVGLYAFIYIPWFACLETHVTTDFHLIHSALDDYIPFIEVFIIPYLLWFAFIAITIGFFFFTDTSGFYRLITFLFSGMTIFLVISTIYPNGLDLRPDIFLRDNIFTDMVKMLYRTDTPTNVLPSIHVYNSLGAYIAISRSSALQKYRGIQVGAFVLTVLIILSTMFLKQHSVIDVLCAFLMAAAAYVFVYAPHTEHDHSYAKGTL